MKVAVIGRGFGAGVMAPAFEKLGHTVEIVPSRDMAAVEKACKGDADLIAVHSPPFQHRDHVLAALAQGKPVLCDKPFGLNADEAREMRDAAKAAGVLHFLNFEMRCFPAWSRAQKMIEDGAIGTLVHVSWSKFGRGLRVRDHGWLNDADLGGGWIGASGSHDIDALRFLFGREIVRAGGQTRTEVPMRGDGQGGQVRSTAEDAFSLWFELEGGGTASVDSAFAASVNLPATFHLIGSDGAITIGSESSLTVVRHKAEPEKIDLSGEAGAGGFMDAVGVWLGKVTRAMETGEQIAPNFEDGLAAALVIDRIRADAVRAADCEGQ